MVKYSWKSRVVWVLSAIWKSGNPIGKCGRSLALKNCWRTLKHSGRGLVLKNRGRKLELNWRICGPVYGDDYYLYKLKIIKWLFNRNFPSVENYRYQSSIKLISTQITEFT